MIGKRKQHNPAVRNICIYIYTSSAAVYTCGFYYVIAKSPRRWRLKCYTYCIIYNNVQTIKTRKRVNGIEIIIIIIINQCPLSLVENSAASAIVFSLYIWPRYNRCVTAVAPGNRYYRRPAILSWVVVRH